MQLELDSIVTRTEAIASALHAVEWAVLAVEDDDERHALAASFARQAKALADALLTDRLYEPESDHERVMATMPRDFHLSPALFAVKAAGADWGL